MLGEAAVVKNVETCHVVREGREQPFNCQCDFVGFTVLAERNVVGLRQHLFIERAAGLSARSKILSRYHGDNVPPSESVLIWMPLGP